MMPFRATFRISSFTTDFSPLLNFVYWRAFCPGNFLNSIFVPKTVVNMSLSDVRDFQLSKNLVILSA